MYFSDDIIGVIVMYLTPLPFIEQLIKIVSERKKDVIRYRNGRSRVVGNCSWWDGSTLQFGKGSMRVDLKERYYCCSDVCVPRNVVFTKLNDEIPQYIPESHEEFKRISGASGDFKSAWSSNGYHQGGWKLDYF